MKIKETINGALARYLFTASQYMTQLAFTVCTNSHLAKAKSMADSLRVFNPDLQLIIGLVDELTPAIAPAFFAPHTLLEIKNIGIPDFEKLLKQYNPFELSCLGKPCFADYLLRTNPDLTQLYYFDADVYFYENIGSIEKLLDHNDIVITAHSFVDLPNGGLPAMRVFLNSGLYNGGFFALKRSPESLKFIEWWKNRLRSEGYFNFAEGMFVDQLWLNFVPLLFKNVLIDPHLGHNVGYWNMHERAITVANSQYVVNETWPLVFFHFSGFSPFQPHEISVHQDRYRLDGFPALAAIFDAYGQSLLANNHAYYQSIPNAYFKPRFIVQKLTGLRKKLLIATRKLTRLLES